MKLHKIEAGTFKADGGAIFGVVPKKVWQKRYPCDDANFCKLTMRCLLIQDNNRLILIDNGVGDKQLEEIKYYHMEGIVDFEIELNKLGYSCSEVSDVILTHLHFDHCGSSTAFTHDKSKVVPTFPNAHYWVGKSQWKNFLNPNVREGDSYFQENMMPIYEAGKLKLVEQPHYISENVELRICNGHTIGQIVPYIRYENRTIVYCGDVIPLMASIPIAWISAYDTYPIVSMEDKEKLLSEAVSKKQILFFEHDLYNECCTVYEINGKYRVGESFTLEEIDYK